MAKIKYLLTILSKFEEAKTLDIWILVHEVVVSQELSPPSLFDVQFTGPRGSIFIESSSSFGNLIINVTKKF